MSCELQRTQAECMKLFVRAARRIFSEILQFFRAILAQHLRDLDAERALFRNGTHCRFGQLQPTFCSMRSGCWPNARSFCARGAPEFRKFCNFFAQVWRKICVTSTSDAHFFVFGRTADSMKSFSDVLQFTQRMLADLKQFLCARRVKIPGNFAIISRDFCGRFA